MRPHYRFPERKQKHVCAICSEVFIWSDKSIWIGHYDDLMLKACSQECLNLGKDENTNIGNELDKRKR